MDGQDEQELFLKTKPPYSRTRVDKHGKLWRDGEQYDAETIDAFLAYNAILIDELLKLSKESIASFIIPIASESGDQVLPDSNTYTLTARVKTVDTLLGKMRRMPGTPISNIQDIAGVRFDCDLTLTEQTEVAEAFANTYSNAGAKRVDVQDLRDSPHSGYRAVHVTIRSDAGRAEVQIRTALQSKWANLYEEAADILGRDIRYLHKGAKMPPGADGVVKDLHSVSDIVRRVEELSDNPKVTRGGEVRELRSDVYGILDRIHGDLTKRRMQFRMS